MPRIFIILAVCFAALSAHAQTATTLGLAGGPGAVASASGYTGPGDIESGVAYYYSVLRAFSSATRGNKQLNLCNSTGGVDVLCADASSDAVTGLLVVPGTLSAVCPGSNCTIKIYYDVSGNGYDTTEATIAERNILTTSCTTASLCSLTPSDQSHCYLSAKTLTLAQPFTVVGAVLTDSTAKFQIFVSDSADAVEYGFTTTPKAYGYAGTEGDVATVSKNVFYSFQIAFNGSSSTANINGTAYTGIAVGATGFVGTYPTLFGYGTTGPACSGTDSVNEGQFIEGGVFSGASAVMASMNTNIRTAGGF